MMLDLQRPKLMVVTAGCLSAASGLVAYDAFQEVLAHTSNGPLTAAIVLIGLRTGFLVFVGAVFKSGSNTNTKMLFGVAAACVSLTMGTWILVMDGWITLLHLTGIDLLIFALVASEHDSWRRNAKPAPAAIVGDPIGIFEIIRDYGARRGPATLLCLPVPPRSAQEDRVTRACIQLLAHKGQLHGSRIVSADRAAHLIGETHEQLFKHRPRWFEFYHVRRGGFTSLWEGEHDLGYNDVRL